MLGVCQQILGAERNALQRAAQTLALDIAVHILSLTKSRFAERKRQRVVARADAFQAVAKCARQINRGKLLAS